MPSNQGILESFRPFTYTLSKLHTWHVGMNRLLPELNRPHGLGKAALADAASEGQTRSGRVLFHFYQ